VRGRFAHGTFSVSTISKRRLSNSDSQVTLQFTCVSGYHGLNHVLNLVIQYMCMVCEIVTYLRLHARYGTC
jgi:hypothetical protein